MLTLCRLRGQSPRGVKTDIERQTFRVANFPSAVSLRIKNQDVRDERTNLQRAVEERDYTILDLRSLLKRRNRELNVLEQSEATTQDERTRLQLHSNEMSMSLIAIRQELEEFRAAATAARVSVEAGRVCTTVVIVCNPNCKDFWV